MKTGRAIREARGPTGRRRACARGRVPSGARGNARTQRLVVALCAVAALGLAVADGAAAQKMSQHELTWAHASPSHLGGFVVFVSPVAGSVDRARRYDVGLPQSKPSGSLRVYSAIVSASVDEFVAVAAVDRRGRLSALSDWSGLPPSPPGQPFLIGP